MRSTSRGGAALVRPWAACLLAVTLVALGPAAARCDDGGGARLRPEQIRMVQQALRGRGLTVEPTGAWDEPTRSALAEFQGSSGLTATGQLDAATVQALGVNLNAVAGPARRREARRDPMYNCEIYNTIDCDPGGGG